MRQTDGVILEAIYYDVIRTSSAIVRVSYACRLPASTYEADTVISPFENKVWESTKV